MSKVYKFIVSNIFIPPFCLISRCFLKFKISFRFSKSRQYKTLLPSPSYSYVLSCPYRSAKDLI